MVSVINNIYKLSNTSEENLKNLGFHYDRGTSNRDVINYSYKFPVYKYEGKILLNCEITIEINTKIVSVNVYQQNGKTYSPFYCSEFNSNNLVVNTNLNSL